MGAINRYFDQVFCINIARRTDKWKLFCDDMAKQNIEFQRIEGCDMPRYGNHGCTEAHGKLLSIIASSTWNRVLVFEDDSKPVFDNVNARFEEMMEFYPKEWDLFYLGGHYADKPKSRFSKHVVRINRMHTTSSYGVTREMAAKMHPVMHSIGPVDCVFSGFAETHNAYCLQPRLFVQRNCFSDIQEKDCNNEPCMMDTNHENMV